MKQLIRNLVLSIEAKDSLIIMAVIFFIMAAGAIYSFHLGDNLRYEDEIEYRALAQNLISTHSYTLDGVHPTLFHPPVTLYFFRRLSSSAPAYRYYAF